MEAVRDCENYDDGKCVVGCIRLERSLEWEGVKEAVDLEGFAETLEQVSSKSLVRRGRDLRGK